MLKRQNSTAFQLQNKTVQIFFTDGSELVVFQQQKEFWYHSGSQFQRYTAEELKTCSDTEFLKRVKYMKKIYQSLKECSVA
jgi:hypothetical protein